MKKDLFKLELMPNIKDLNFSSIAFLSVYLYKEFNGGKR
jgi:hypothetical protein